jgi:hypothetical protein
MQKQNRPFKPRTPNYNRKFKSTPFNRFPPISGPPKSFNHPGGQSSPQQHTSSPQQGFSFNNSNWVPCQICGKTSHQALDCFHRMDYSFQGRHPPSQLTAMVAYINSEIEDQQWLALHKSSNWVLRMDDMALSASKSRAVLSSSLYF